MIHYFKKILKDLNANFFLNSITVIAIALAVLIFSAFTLFFINADQVLKHWISDMRIVAYIKPGYIQSKAYEKEISGIKEQISSIEGIVDVEFISKAKALEQFKIQLGSQASLVEGLKDNPLPDSFEIRMGLSSDNWNNIEPAAEKIKAVDAVEDVEYGQEWLGKFISFFKLFRLTGYAMGTLFFMAAVFFVANTIRMVLYSRREEIEIMRLVGASDSFIKDPFYIQSLIMGAAGGGMGLGALFLLIRFISLNFEISFSEKFSQISFLPLELLIGILLGSMFVGWTGCFISLRQFLKS
ncbi:putative ABC transporter permease domain-containing protein [Desulfonema limicola]|uniref:Cell division protein FtsX n=1 Tax=Desulfonema limicola TaxID=45656 RepID=A0A975BBN1_9BACT|nr:permease-like cell division protein FtsX [Desulfonema limicola]QTA82669.1 putative ABC transporter permease domain-containing protein [Desulfonema limicola]